MNRLDKVSALFVGIIALLFAFPPGAWAQGEVPRFEPSDCPIDVPADPPIDCGYLVVPEDYDQPGGATIRLPVIIIHSRGEDPAPDPLLFTIGGPAYRRLSVRCGDLPDRLSWMFATSSFSNSAAICMPSRAWIVTSSSCR